LEEQERLLENKNQENKKKEAQIKVTKFRFHGNFNSL
jgi:hypothetical protein